MPETPLAEWFRVGGFLQYELAAELGISTGYLSHLKKGTRCPSLRLAKQIADATGLAVEDLIPAEK